MPQLDRAEILARTDLADLATEICGPPRGQGRSSRWHCPNPDHPDRNPSMGMYTSARTGDWRWKCHACGEGGTAVDLLMISSRMSPGDALRNLAERAGVSPGSRSTPNRTYARPARPPAPPTEAARVPHPAIETLVARAAELLWQPIGDYARRRLHARGLLDGVLKANRVGFDPGPSVLPRPDGLPHRSPGITFPALDHATGAAVYYQLRSLSPRHAADRKYDQPSLELAPNPRLVRVRSAEELRSNHVLIICEGFPDALCAVQAGVPSAAVLGIDHAGTDRADSLAERILTEHIHGAYAVCFDSDARAQAAAARLADCLAQRGADVARLQPPDNINDLNDWWQAAPQALARQLAAAATLLSEASGVGMAPQSYASDRRPRMPPAWAVPPPPAEHPSVAGPSS
jgi:hypothetical protein